jgi:hypothetical protein
MIEKPDQLRMFHDRSFTLALKCVRAILQLRRERIAERMKSLQELVPNANKVAASPHSPLSSFA